MRAHMGAEFGIGKGETVCETYCDDCGAEADVGCGGGEDGVEGVEGGYREDGEVGTEEDCAKQTVDERFFIGIGGDVVMKDVGLDFADTGADFGGVA